MELVRPAGNLPSLKAAVDNGANAVYMGFRDDTNARHFAGLNFDDRRAQAGIHYAHDHGTKVFVAINTNPQPANWTRWQASVDHAADLGAVALILAAHNVFGIFSSLSQTGAHTMADFCRARIREWRVFCVNPYPDRRGSFLDAGHVAQPEFLYQAYC